MKWLDHDRIFNIITIVLLTTFLLLIIYGLPELFKLAFNHGWEKGTEDFK